MNREGMKVKILEHVSDARQEEIERLAHALPDLGTVLDRWLKDPRHSLTVYVSDDTDEVGANQLVVVLGEGKENHKHAVELAEIFCPIAWVRERYAGWCDIRTFVQGFDPESASTLFDYDAKERWTATLGLRYSEFFAHPLGPQSACLPLLIAYIITLNGNVSIDPIADYFYDDYSPEELESEGIGPQERYRMCLVGADLGIEVDGMRPGLASHLFFDWEDPQPPSQLSQTGAQPALPT